MLDVTPFKIERSFTPEGVSDILIRYPYSWIKYNGIPDVSAMGMYCNITFRSERYSGNSRLASALGKMAGSDFNFGETLVELDQSFNMVHNSLRRLYLYFAYAKSGNIQGLRQLIKSNDFRLRGVTPKKRVANAYLEYSFGWSPLINDVYNALTQSHKLLTEKGAMLRRSSGRNHGFLSDDFLGIDSSRAGAFGIIRNNRTSVANQLGLINPMLMAWNRLPFSFLVDWVIPISSYLGALTWDAGLIYQSAYRVESEKNAGQVSKNYRPDLVPFKVGDYYRRSEVRRRVPVNNRFIAPDLSSNHFQLSLSKIATLAALFTQLNSR